MKRLLLLPLMALLLTACTSSRNDSGQPRLQDRVIVLCVNDFADLVQSGRLRVIDVRTRTEYNEGHIPGAENVDINQPDFIEKLRPRTDLAVYCRSGKRSSRAAQLIVEQGYAVYELGGGFNAWQQAGKPTVQ